MLMLLMVMAMRMARMMMMKKKILMMFLMGATMNFGHPKFGARPVGNGIVVFTINTITTLHFSMAWTDSS